MWSASASRSDPSRFAGKSGCGGLVVPDHRGRRLGLRLKATNQRLLLEAFPACRTILTGNADVNAAMSSVNERLGFRSVEQVHEMQKQLGNA